MISTAKSSLLGSVVDYAGTFPPAKLSLNDALKRAGSYRQEGRHPWLMSKIALPISAILELNAPELMRFDPTGGPWVFTALGAAHDIEGIRGEIKRLGRWNRVGETALCRHLVVSYETKIFLESPPNTETLNKLGPEFLESGIYPYFEISPAHEEQWENLANQLSQTPALRSGLKIRTGGALVPTTKQLATCIQLCAKYRLRFKATQGLHHPISNEKEYGFVNLFAALSIANACDASVEQLERCLEDRQADGFRFEENKFYWEDLSLTVEQIQAARELHAGCFGSCSIDEPDEYLARQFP